MIFWNEAGFDMLWPSKTAIHLLDVAAISIINAPFFIMLYTDPVVWLTLVGPCKRADPNLLKRKSTPLVEDRSYRYTNQIKQRNHRHQIQGSWPQARHKQWFVKVAEVLIVLAIVYLDIRGTSLVFRGVKHVRPIYSRQITWQKYLCHNVVKAETARQSTLEYSTELSRPAEVRRRAFWSPQPERPNASETHSLFSRNNIVTPSWVVTLEVDTHDNADMKSESRITYVSVVTCSISHGSGLLDTYQPEFHHTAYTRPVSQLWPKISNSSELRDLDLSESLAATSATSCSEQEISRQTSDCFLANCTIEHEICNLSINRCSGPQTRNQISHIRIPDKLRQCEYTYAKQVLIETSTWLAQVDSVLEAVKTFRSLQLFEHTYSINSYLQLHNKLIVSLKTFYQSSFKIRVGISLARWIGVIQICVVSLLITMWQKPHSSKMRIGAVFKQKRASTSRISSPQASHRDQQACARGLQIVTWTCSCGMTLFDVYSERVPGSTFRLQQSLQRNFYRSTIYRRLLGYLWSFIPRTFLGDQENSQTNTTNAQLEPPIASSHLPQIVIKHALGDTNEQLRTQDSSQSHVAQTQPPSTNSYLLLCFPENFSGVKLYHEQVMTGTRYCRASNDKQLFKLLNERYNSVRNVRFPRIWPRTISRVSLANFLVDIEKFVDLRHYGCQTAPPDCRCIPPPTNNDYHYMPKVPEYMPPIGKNYLTHYVQNPDCIKSDSLAIALNQIPKRLSECIVASGQTRTEAWGIEFEEGWHRGKVQTLFVIIMIVGSITFLALWWWFQNDLQGAASMASVFIGVAAIVGYIATGDSRMVS